MTITFIMRTNSQSLLSKVIPQTIKDYYKVDITRFKLETGRVLLLNTQAIIAKGHS